MCAWSTRLTRVKCVCLFDDQLNIVLAVPTWDDLHFSSGHQGRLKPHCFKHRACEEWDNDKLNDMK